MTSNQDDPELGRLDDDAEEHAESSTTDGPAAAGEYDPAQGSPDAAHPAGQEFPDEAVRYDQEQRPRSSAGEE
jgi:hypothetical protein